ncbi:MAG TPA: DUF3558 domain-containing protein [Pseudonocardiaceae bacterium]
MRTKRPPRLSHVVAGVGITLAVLIGLALTTFSSPIYSSVKPNNQSSSESGTASPLSTVTVPTVATLTLPPPDRALPLDNVNPCRILTSSQRSALSLDSTPVAYTDDEFDKARACTIRGVSSGTVAELALVTDMSVNVWLSDEAQVSATPINVAGWPALVVRTPGLNSVCTVEVDTSANQFLDVLFRDGGNNPPLSQDTLCAGAQRVAQAAVTSLSKTD